MGPLPPEAEGVEELVVEKLSMIWRMEATQRLSRLEQCFLRELRLGGWMRCMPRSFRATADGSRCPPSPRVDYVRSRGSLTHTQEPLVRLSPHGEESLRQLLVGGGSGRETEAANDPRGIDRSELKPSCHPRLLDQPMCRHTRPAILPHAAWRPGRASPSYPGLGNGTFVPL
jgi:hypothetical protein